MTSATDRTGLLSIAALALALVAAPAVAVADPKEADVTFKKGRDLFRAGQFDAACEQFEASLKLDRALGTLFNLAQCDEKIGKLASAIAAYREIVDRDNNAKRKSTAAEYAVKLELRVPKIVVQVANPQPAMKITLDGRAVDPGQPIEVDYGDYAVAIHVDGWKDEKRAVAVHEEHKTWSIAITLQSDHAPPAGNDRVPGTGDHDNAKPPANAKSPPPPPPASSSRKLGGKVAVGVGGAAIAGGLVFGVLAHGKWNDARAVCGGTVCPTQALVDQANGLGNDARGLGNLASGFAIGGLVVAAVGVALIVTAPSDEHAPAVTVSASADSHGGTAWLVGRF